jgi:hypothetical protein
VEVAPGRDSEHEKDAGGEVRQRAARAAFVQSDRAGQAGEPKQHDDDEAQQQAAGTALWRVIAHALVIDRARLELKRRQGSITWLGSGLSFGGACE